MGTLNLHRTKILTDRTAADARLVDDGPEELPAFILLDEPLRLIATNLLV